MFLTLLIKSFESGFVSEHTAHFNMGMQIKVHWKHEN